MKQIKRNFFGRWESDFKSNETIDLHKISKHSRSRSGTSAQTTEIIKKCKFWENSHHRGKCPAYGKACHNCNRKNHFKKCCPRNRNTLHEIEQTETESPSADEYEFFLDEINLQKNPKNVSQIKNEPSDWNITLSSNFYFYFIYLFFPVSLHFLSYMLESYIIAVI